MNNCIDIVNLNILLEPMNLKDIWRYEEKNFFPGDREKVVLRTTNSSWNYAYKVTLDNTEANAIKAAYQQAVRSGAFK